MAKLRVEQGFFHRTVAPLHLFVAGMLTIPAYLFQDVLVVKVIQSLAFAGLARMAGKRIKWLYFLIMVTSITVFHLLTPVGRIMAEIGRFAITAGALELGLRKGFTIVGLVFLSLGTISRRLQLPGTLGGLIGRLFYYFESIFESKGKVDAKNLIPSLDEILKDLYQPWRNSDDGPKKEEEDPEEALRAVSPGGYIVLGAFVLTNWLLLLV